MSSKLFLNKNKLLRLIKDNLKYYFFSDFIKDFIKKKNSSHPNQQANWFGEKLENHVPKDEKIFFEKLNLKSFVLTADGVTKNVGLFKDYLKIDCFDLDQSKSHIQFSFWAKFWEKKSILKIKINDESYEFKNIKNLVYLHQKESWFDISIKIKNKFKFLEIFCENEEIFFTKPITYNHGQNFNLLKNRDNVDHIIVIVLDGVVADYLNNKKLFYKDKYYSTNIDNYFKDYFKTNYAFSTSEWTLPAISSFFSGMYTSQHRLFKPREFNFYDNKLPSLPQKLKNNGFKTQFFSTGNRTTPLFGINKGFQRIFYSHPHGLTKSIFKTHDWINKMIDFLEVYKNEKTFSYLHFPNTHQEWMTPGFDNLSFSLNRNDSLGLNLDKIEEDDAFRIENLRIYEFDLIIENLFHYINKNLNNRTGLILTGDHGSPFYKKYSKTLAKIDDIRPTLNYKRTNVPFFCRFPDFIKKNYISDGSQIVSSNLDLSKTILDLCKIDSLEFNNGVSIFDQENRRKFAISESIYNNLCEIAVINKEYSFFQRSQFDEKKFLIDQNQKSKKLFFKTNSNYNKNLMNEENTEFFEKIVENHINRYF